MHRLGWVDIKITEANDLPGFGRFKQGFQFFDHIGQGFPWRRCTGEWRYDLTHQARSYPYLLRIWREKYSPADPAFWSPR